MSRLFSTPREQYFDGNGDPYSGGKLNFYETGTTTRLDTYSDNDLTTANANPVVADANGNFEAIFLRPKDYKVVLTDSNDVTVWTQDPVHGKAITTGVITKTSGYTVTTGDDGKMIDADASGGNFTVTLPAASTAGDGFQIGVKNTGASGTVTVDADGSETIDGATTYALSTQYSVVFLRCDGSEWFVTLSDATEVSRDTSPQLGGALDTNSFAVNFSEGSDVASATSPDIWATDGNTVHITGTTQIDDFANAPRIGASRWLIFDGALTFTHGSGITLPGSASITTAAGDIAYVYADAVDAFRVAYFPADGEPVVAQSSGLTLGTEQATTSGTSKTFGSIPSGTTMIIVMFKGVSFSAGVNALLRIGDSGGIESSGYVAQARTSTLNLTSTTEFGLFTGGGLGDIWNGSVFLSLENSSNNTWAASWSLGDTGNSQCAYGGGYKSLSGELTQLSISGGTFDAGAINISYM